MDLCYLPLHWTGTPSQTQSFFSPLHLLIHSRASAVHSFMACWMAEPCPGRSVWTWGISGPLRIRRHQWLRSTTWVQRGKRELWNSGERWFTSWLLAQSSGTLRKWQRRRVTQDTVRMNGFSFIFLIVWGFKCVSCPPFCFYEGSAKRYRTKAIQTSKHCNIICMYTTFTTTDGSTNKTCPDSLDPQTPGVAPPGACDFIMCPAFWI